MPEAAASKETLSKMLEIELPTARAWVRGQSTSRAEALRVACPICGAGVDALCIEGDHERRSLHEHRHALAIQTGVGRVRYIGGRKVRYDDYLEDNYVPHYSDRPARNDD